MPRLAYIEMYFVVGIFLLEFLNAMATVVDLELLGEFRYVKEIVVTRGINILVMCSILGGWLFLIIRQ